MPTTVAGGGADAIRAAARGGAAPETAALLDEDDVRVLALLAQGLTFEATAARTGCSRRTLRRRVRAVCDRLGVETTIEAIIAAVHAGRI